MTLVGSLVIRRYLLQKFFLLLFEVGGFFISTGLRQRFIQNWYWKQARLGVVSVIPGQQALYNFFLYLVELCTLQSRVIVLGHAVVDLDVFFNLNLQDLWTNYFISGMGARFANFLNWNKMFLVDRGRSPNRRRFHTPDWWAHYTARRPGRIETRDIGALVLHKYYFRRLVGYPRIFMDPVQVRRDFFVPISPQMSRLWLFSFMYMIIRIFFYYRARAIASRFFWDTRFLVGANRTSLGVSANVFKFAFTLHGRQYDKMQLWEYTTFLDSFTTMGPVVARIHADELRYDPKV